MSALRTLPLYDEHARPPCWNERMAAGEYAVHHSSFDSSAAPPFCTVFGSLEEAKAHAAEEITQRPDTRCRIYDHHGFVGAPICEFTGRSYKETGEISARFRRWVGSLLFFPGVILTAIDWYYDFSLNWPAMIGTRMLFPGLILLVTEGVIIVNARRRVGHLK